MNANWFRSVLGCCLVASPCVLVTPLCGQQSLESTYRMTGSAVTAAFEAQRAVLQRSSAVILDGRTETVYGVVVSPDGYILTKASEVAELAQPAVIVDKTKYPTAKVLIVDPEWDVALLKIDAAGLEPVIYAPTSAVPQGTWVVANGATSRTQRRALGGIISAKIREIPAAGGAALGVVLKSDSKQLELEAVSDGGGAKAAGLQAGDVILEVDGQAVKQLADIAKVLKDRKAGSMVQVTFRRGKEQRRVEVRLTAKTEAFSDEMMNRNDMMSGDFSKRRSGFPRVLQHDILGSSRFTGGPLLDLDGRCLGMNIARANRAESFAIPVEDLKAVAARLIQQAAATPPAGDVAKPAN